MIDFISIIISVFAVLQIILFFKLWRMTDDVKAISQNFKYSGGDYVLDAKTAYLNGQKQIAQEMLDKALIIVKEELNDNPQNVEFTAKKIQIINTIKYLGLELAEADDFKYKIGDSVIWISRNEQVKIKGIAPDGRYTCYSLDTNAYVGDFKEKEIKLLED